MDGGIVPDRPDELDADVNMNEALADVPEETIMKVAVYLSAAKEKVSCGWGGSHPRVVAAFVE